MTSDQVTGLIRTVLAILGGVVVSKGWFADDIWNWVSAGILTLIPAFWTIWNNRPAALAASAQRLDGVTVVTSSEASPGVVAAVNAAKANG